MNQLLKQLAKLTPGISYRSGASCYWSPEQQMITYKANQVKPSAQWTLLHEAAHAILGHTDYKTDIELLLLEVAAWEKAKQLGIDLGVAIDEEHIQDCLDTYRDWLHERSTCPRCSVVSMQISTHEYSCHNCSARWQVSTSRFHRPYRRSTDTLSQSKSRPEVTLLTTFE